ncbi:hypothetical protein LAJ19_06805 [Deinococcus taeanensis]|uniref:hypothetical protein n=1 Tax=Deinococcus taeanensis TaxID=2737050 RepID=UPI001CDBB5E7|nr:hypothetical protein [Deinococcus taeanensis]UBV43916.1 hypothetical protein LAJ19_06805 [Deinococcus taeanensis]
MTPDEWTAGIHNEADSVNDLTWAQDTRAHLHRQRRARTALSTLLVAGGSLGASAAVTLGTLWDVLSREAERNDVSTFTFLTWNALGNPQPVTTIINSADPQLPTTALLLALFMLAAVATRLHVPRWLTLLSAALGTLTISTLAQLVLPNFAGFPAFPLTAALGVATLGILLGLPFRHSRRPA